MSESFETFYKRTREQYAPSLMEYTPEDMESLREQIATWLRPSYEQAMKKQEKQAAIYNGKLDADAWSRGMGSSTYVSDLKYRRQNELLESQAELEASYGAALAEQLYKAWEKQQGYRLEAEKFNAQAKNEANAKALTAAEELYGSYLASLNRYTGGSGQNRANKSGAESEAEVNPLTPEEQKQQMASLQRWLNNRGKPKQKYTGGGSDKISETHFTLR